MSDFPERDWKVFRELHRTLANRYAERVLEQVRRLSEDRKEEGCSRFWDVYELMCQEAKDLDSVGDYRRSTAFMVITRFYSLKLFRPEEFEKFSEKTRNEITSWVDAMNARRP